MAIFAPFSMNANDDKYIVINRGGICKASRYIGKDIYIKTALFVFVILQKSRTTLLKQLLIKQIKQRVEPRVI